MLPPLAIPSDASLIGITATEQNLRRASTRVRAYTKQQISAGTSLITGYGTAIALPQRPTRSVQSVTDRDGYDVSWELDGNMLSTRRGGYLTIAYSHGFEIIPDEIVELVCTIASRLGNIDPSAAAGVQQESGGNESVGFGFDSYNAITELATGEKRVLDRLFPKLASTVVLRP